MSYILLCESKNMSRGRRCHRPPDEGSNSRSTNSYINHLGEVVHWASDFDDIKWTPLRAGLGETMTVLLLPLEDQRQTPPSHETSARGWYLAVLNACVSHSIPLLHRYLLWTRSGPVARNIVLLALRVIRVEKKRRVIRRLLQSDRQHVLAFHVSASPVSLINSLRATIS